MPVIFLKVLVQLENGLFRLGNLFMTDCPLSLALTVVKKSETSSC